MSTTSTNMGLVEWNELTDPYDSSQLVFNWEAIDNHNHTTGKGVQIPTGGIIDGAITNAKVNSSAAIVYSKLNLGGNVVNADISSSAAIANSKLATSGVTAGSYNNVTVNDRGIVTAGANIGYGSTLPSSPAAGDEYYYVADSTNGVIWHLRYKDGTNKWEFVGGAPLAGVQNTGTSSTFTSTTYIYDLTTADGPSVTVPLTGTYRMEFGYDVSISSNNQTAVMGLHTSSTANTGLITGAELSVEPINSGRTVTSAKFVHYYSLSAGTIYAQFKVTGGTATVTNRWIAITPSKLG